MQVENKEEATSKKWYFWVVRTTKSRTNNADVVKLPLFVEGSFSGLESPDTEKNSSVPKLKKFSNYPSKIVECWTESQRGSLSLTTPTLGQTTQIKQLFWRFLDRMEAKKSCNFLTKSLGPAHDPPPKTTISFLFFTSPLWYFFPSAEINLNQIHII